MTTLTTALVAAAPTQPDAEPINLYNLGMLFVVKCRYWSCRAGNDADDLKLDPQDIDSKAIASFGTKDLLDPALTRKKFQTVEKKARHCLEKHSRPFAAANARFVPWKCVQSVIAELEACRTEFDQLVGTFLAEYAKLRADWQLQHPGIPDGAYPSELQLPQKFGLTWHSFKVTGAPELSPVEDIEMELEQRQARDEQMHLMQSNLRRECQEFVTGYVMSFRHEVAAFCAQVVEQNGNVHGRTLTAIRDRISRFHEMNVFDDTDAAAQLDQLKEQISGLTGQDLDQQPDVAAKLSAACAKLQQQMLAPGSVSQLTGRLRRRVVLD